MLDSWPYIHVRKTYVVHTTNEREGVSKSDANEMNDFTILL